MPTLLPDLPPELQFLIISHCPTNDAICLSLTCKTLYILSVPLGHCKVAITNSDMITPFEGHTQSNRPRSPCPRNIISHVRNNYHTGVCTTRGCHAPCACYGCTLYTRLRAWMPKELRYCPKCHKFTKRDEKKRAKKKQNGICPNHKVGPRRKPKTHWTYHKGRGGWRMRA